MSETKKNDQSGLGFWGEQNNDSQPNTMAKPVQPEHYVNKENRRGLLAKIWKRIRNRMTGNNEGAQRENSIAPKRTEEPTANAVETYLQKMDIESFGNKPEHITYQYLENVLDFIQGSDKPFQDELADQNQDSWHDYVSKTTEQHMEQVDSTFASNSTKNREKLIISEIKTEVKELYENIKKITPDTVQRNKLLTAIQFYLQEMVSTVDSIQTAKELMSPLGPLHTAGEDDLVAQISSYGDEAEVMKMIFGDITNPDNLASKNSSDAQLIVAALLDLFDTYKAQRIRQLQAWESFQSKVVPKLTMTISSAKSTESLEQAYTLTLAVLNQEAKKRNVEVSSSIKKFLEVYKSLYINAMNLISTEKSLDNFSSEAESLLDTIDDSSEYKQFLVQTKDRLAREIDVILQKRANTEVGRKIINTFDQAMSPKYIDQVLEEVAQNTDSSLLNFLTNFAELSKLRFSDSKTSLASFETSLKDKSVSTIESARSVEDVDLVINRMVTALTLFLNEDRNKSEKDQQSLFLNFGQVNILMAQRTLDPEFFKLLPENIRYVVLMGTLKKAFLEVGSYAESSVQAAKNINKLKEIAKAGLLSLESDEMKVSWMQAYGSTIQTMDRAYSELQMLDSRLDFDFDSQKPQTEEKVELFAEFASQTILDFLKVTDAATVRKLATLSKGLMAARYFNQDNNIIHPAVKNWTELVDKFADFYIKRVLEADQKTKTDDFAIYRELGEIIALSNDKRASKLASKLAKEYTSFLINKGVMQEGVFRTTMDSYVVVHSALLNSISEDKRGDVAYSNIIDTVKTELSKIRSKMGYVISIGTPPSFIAFHTFVMSELDKLFILGRITEPELTIAKTEIGELFN